MDLGAHKIKVVEDLGRFDVPGFACQSGAGGDVAQVSGAWNRWRAAEEKLAEAREAIAQAKADQDLLLAHIEELNALAPEGGEEQALADARSTMQKGEKLAEDLEELRHLWDGSDSALAILRAYGLTPKSAEIVREEPDLAEDMLLHGQLDAFFTISGVPDTHVADLANRGAIDIVPVGGDAAAKLVAAHPELSLLHIPADTYRFSPALDTLAVNAVWICNAKADADLVHEMTRALFEPGNRDLLPATDDMPPLPKKHDRTMEDSMRRSLMMGAASDLPIPLHDGAARFYREEGVVPAN